MDDFDFDSLTRIATTTTTSSTLSGTKSPPRLKIVTILQLSKETRNNICTCIVDKIYHHVNDPLQFNRSDAVINSNTINGTGSSQTRGIAWADAREVANTLLRTEFAEYHMTVHERMRNTPRMVNDRKNTRAYDDIKRLIYDTIKSRLVLYADELFLHKQNEKERIRQRALEAEARIIQQLKHQKQQKNEDEEEEEECDRVKSTFPDQSALYASLKVFGDLESEWD